MTSPLVEPPEPTPDEVLAKLELYRETLRWLFLCTLLIVTILLAALVAMELANHGLSSTIHVPILLLVSFCGALGALFSSLTRLYSLRQLPAAILYAGRAKEHGRYLIIFCMVPPCIGMIGATFFYTVVASGIVSGDLFQKFACDLPQGCDGMSGLLSYSPAGATDYAKSIVWGFAAGFSERLVPDALARLEKPGA